jgi:predicted ferric reductase
MTATATTTAPATGGRHAGAVRRDRADRAWIVTVAVVVNGLVAVGLWLRHGELASATGPGAVATAIGQLTGLLGAYALLVGLLLMARVPWLERFLGFDRLAVWHRWVGFTTVWLLVTHTVFITIGYARANRESLVGQTLDFARHYPDVLMAFVALGLLLAVAATSMRVARRELRRETWHATHLYAYLAVALGFAHQLAVGSDFSGDAVARAWWVALFVATIGAVAVWRLGAPLVFNLHHRLRVADVRREAPGVVSITMTGRDLRSIGAEPGQFFVWRFLAPGTAWRARPFSLSAPVGPNRVRITVKQTGEQTRVLQHVRPGTRVLAEGPYGTFTSDRRTRRRAVLIAGGIGITPLRALLETIPAAPGDLVLLYRVATPDDLLFRDELTELGIARGIALHALTGTEIGDDDTDRLGVPAIRALVPDVRERDCFVCGPPGLVDAVRRRLRRLGVPRAQIHFERFEY